MGTSSMSEILCNIANQSEALLAPHTNQLGHPPIGGCLQLIVQYIRSYAPYLEAVFSIRSLWTCHAMMVWTRLT
jgi:hypothetical protein